jgi:hypothetical protein
VTKIKKFINFLPGRRTRVKWGQPPEIGNCSVISCQVNGEL